MLTTATQQMEQALKLESFAAWLATKNDDEIVGTPGNDSCCPIATYLKETTPNKLVAVGTKWVKSYEDDATRCTGKVYLPKWAEWFIENVDLLHPDTPITAPQAKQALLVWAVGG